MIITAPVTDYIPASVLTTHGDLVERGAAIPERLAAAAAGLVLKATGAGATPAWLPHHLSDSGIYINHSTRNTDGDQVITGVGFTSSLIIFIACNNSGTLLDLSWGFDDGISPRVIFISNDGTNSEMLVNRSIQIRKTAPNDIWGLVTAIGGDGFTITWTLSGVVQANFIYLCFA